MLPLLNICTLLFYHATLLLADGDCMYDNGLDLQPLKSWNIQCVFEDDPSFVLQYSPCESDLQCNVFDGNIWMVLQNSIGGGCAAGVAKFDETQPQRTTVDGKDAFQFVLSTGQASYNCVEQRQLELTFVCDSSTDAPYNAFNLKCGEKEQCLYYLTIHTKHACVASEEEEEGLSVGSVILIIFLIMILIYCIGGYAYNAMKHRDKDCSDMAHNIPHSSFWKQFVMLVLAGCSETKDSCKSKVNGPMETETDDNKERVYSELSNDVVESEEDYRK